MWMSSQASKTTKPTDTPPPTPATPVVITPSPAPAPVQAPPIITVANIPSGPPVSS
jgi:hypothetical protein